MVKMSRIKNWERDDSIADKEAFDLWTFDKCWRNIETGEVVCTTKRRSDGYLAIAFSEPNEDFYRQTIAGCGGDQNKINKVTVDKLRENPNGFFDEIHY